MNTEVYDHIETVLLTEKATLLSEKLKVQIKRAIEVIFKKKVADVNTANFAGKKKRERRADFGRQANWKKAIVTLKEGEKLDLV